MKLICITLENITKLTWYDRVYILSKPLEDLGNSPAVLKILPFFEVDDKIDLSDSKYYFSQTIKYLDVSNG